MSSRRPLGTAARAGVNWPGAARLAARRPWRDRTAQGVAPGGAPPLAYPPTAVVAHRPAPARSVRQARRPCLLMQQLPAPLQLPLGHGTPPASPGHNAGPVSLATLDRAAPMIRRITHLDPLMYEPVLDMSGRHLAELYCAMRGLGGEGGA